MGVRDYVKPVTSIGGTGINGSNAVSNFDNAMRRMADDIVDGRGDGGFMGYGYLTKSANYTVVAADSGKIIDCTAALTLTLPAAASSTGFTILVKANGVKVTLDPNASELVDGSTTKVLQAGFWAMVTCNGTAWFTTAIPSNVATPKDVLVNGNFDVWQPIPSNVNDVDRWPVESSGSSAVSAQRTFTEGQTTVPGNPRFYDRTTTTSVAGAGNYVRKIHKIRDVRTLSGETATLTFWATETTGTKSVAIELVQYFGTGGSPSADVTTIGTQKIALTNGFVKYSVAINIPSISGKVVGGNEDSYLQVIFWFDAGSSFNTRTGSLGGQSAVFDLARVSLAKGDLTLSADPIIPPTFDETLQRCMEFRQVTPACNFIQYANGASASVAQSMTLPVKMVNTPTITTNPTFSYTNGSGGVLTVNASNSVRFFAISTAAGNVTVSTLADGLLEADL